MKITEVRKNYSLSIMYINCKQNYNNKNNNNNIL